MMTDTRIRISELLAKLRHGTIMPHDVFLYSDSLNDYAKYILAFDSDAVLSEEDLHVLDDVLRICNIMYNRTDLEILPIEDGVYDLILERYKKYNPSFQVGSEDVPPFPITENREFDKVCPIVFYTNEEWEKRKNGIFYEDIYLEPHMTNKDLKRAGFYFTDTVSKRSHNTKHEHPDLAGTLDKCKFILMSEAVEKGVEYDPNINILERDFFAKHITSGVLDPNREITMAIELKYDGISVEADCTNIVLSARSRGDTNIGQASDITPILEGYPLHALELASEPPIGVQFEAIMTNADLAKFNALKNYSYKNCRTAIIGLFSSSDAPLYRDLITLVPLALDRHDVEHLKGIEWNRETELKFLNAFYATKGQPLRYVIIKGDYKKCLFLIKKYVEEAEAARDYLDFKYDGVVVEYLDEDLRRALGRKNFVNKYSMAIKFNPLKKETIFRGYTFTIGQNGSITPMIHYDQVEFYGTLHTKSTGSSYDRFLKLGLRVGDIISVEYRHDVMPYVTKPDCEHNRNNHNPLCEFITQCPDCGSQLVLSDSGKTMSCVNIDCKSRSIARMVNMLQKLNLKDFGEEAVKLLGKFHLHELMELKYDDILFIGPTNAKKFIDRMTTLRTEPIYDFDIIGSLGFTDIASKKWKLIFHYITIRELYQLYESDTVNSLSTIKGIGPAVIDTINNEMGYFTDDILYIINRMNNVVDSKGVKFGKEIRCSGFRNAELMEQLRSMGYDADDNLNVTKSTDILLVPNENYSSGKTKKAGPNTLIVPIMEFLEDMTKYLQ